MVTAARVPYDLVSVRHGIFVAPFGELSEPERVAELAARAEERGWDGFFLWDHIAFHKPVRAIADPWVTLAAMAVATQRLLLGPLVTPIPRRRPHKLARETVTLDRLSRGRLVLGVGLGWDATGEFDPDRYGEEGDPRARARLLDDGLDRLLAYWGGEFEPAPVQRPRIPVWVAAGWPRRRPLRRAARFDGVFPIDLPGPEALAELVGEVRSLRGSGDFDVVVTNSPGTDPEPWIAAGATWCLTGLGSRATVKSVRRAIDARPPQP
jgi:alkanesulfonate monooxygenase SsuD/methylene tetrahydromethanopterin reductase-like flavin-dependent oxidoreductase (luciferase family)